MSENLLKLIGVGVMAAIVVVGVVMTNDDDSDFTRNLAFGSGGTDKGAGVPLDTGGTAEEQFEDLLDRNLKFLSAADIQEAKPAYIDRWVTLGKDDNERHYYDQEFSYHFTCDGSFRLWMEPRNGNGDSDVLRSSIGEDRGIPSVQSFRTHRHDRESGRATQEEWFSTPGNPRPGESGPYIREAQPIPRNWDSPEPRYELLSLQSGQRVSASFTITQWLDENGRPYPTDEKENVLLYVFGSRLSDSDRCFLEATFVRSYP